MRPLTPRTRWDTAAVATAAALITASSVTGRALLADGVNIFLAFPPLLAEWLPHIGPGTPVAATTAIAVVAWGPSLAEHLPWPRLLTAAYVAATAWILGLALVDGWQRGVVERLTSDQEYLHDVPRVTDIPLLLRTFADHILTDQPGFWSTHVGAHPPGAFLLFVWLDRIGLGGGGPSGVVVMLVAASSCVAVAVTVRALHGETLARRVLPFGVLLPGAVWMGVSADALFAGILAWGVALLALGATRHRWSAAAAGGVLLGFCPYLSYGLVLAVVFPVAVLITTRNVRAVLGAAAGAAAVVVTFTAAGFWWFDGFRDVQVIYAASIASTRPYGYFVWANLAAAAFAVGPAVVAGLRRRAGALPVAAVVAILLADLSGMSKGEVERIWLPFVVWLVIPCALLPRARAWLAAQALLALAVNHLLLTVW